MSKPNENKTKEVKQKTTGVIKPLVIAAGVIVLAVILYLIFSPTNKDESMDTEFIFKKEGELTFTDSLGNNKAKIDIEIADSEFDRQLGLMYRKQMDENKGMLFIFPVEEMQSFWMHNTFIPLDMLFVNAQKKIVTIQYASTTLSDQSYPSSAPAMYVIEVNAGFTQKHNIKEGDTINFMELTRP